MRELVKALAVEIDQLRLFGDHRRRGGAARPDRMVLQRRAGARFRALRRRGRPDRAGSRSSGARSTGCSVSDGAIARRRKRSTSTPTRRWKVSASSTWCCCSRRAAAAGGSEAWMRRRAAGAAVPPARARRRRPAAPGADPGRPVGGPGALGRRRAGLRPHRGDPGAARGRAPIDFVGGASMGAVVAHRVVVSSLYTSTLRKSEQAEQVLREIIESVPVPV